jgi:hypothetical protein
MYDTSLLEQRQFEILDFRFQITEMIGDFRTKGAFGPRLTTQCSTRASAI